MVFPGIKRTSAADEVFKTLHDWIVMGRLQPGEKLASQDELAKQFAVSRNTLREATYKLRVMGLLTTKQGEGTFVNITSAANYVSSLSDHLLLNPSTVREFLEARVVVEKATVQLAAIRATAEDLRLMNSLLDRQIEAYRARDVDLFSKLDAEFHMRLALTCRNGVLLKFLETIWELLKKFIGEVSQLPGSIENAVGFHERIFRCISNRDVSAAEAEMMRHLFDVVHTIEKNMDVEIDAKSLFEPFRK